ncbi:MAG: NAD kinase [Rickettsiaceae bacterium H1]|nr:NAD kinase [Rickettsiaceae bacterium H1]
MKKIGYVSLNTEKANEVLSDIAKKYQVIDIERNPNLLVDVIIVLGGDGFMLRNLHKFIDRKISIYGINCGSVGFLLNNYQKSDNLAKIIDNSYSAKLIPFKIKAIDSNGAMYHAIAFNEISILRRTCQATFIQISINNSIRLDKLIGDGVLIATAAGSSAYNFSAGGSILPINSGLITLTGINVFRPRRWKSALLPSDVKINIKVLDWESRPVVIAADHNELHDIQNIEIMECREKSITLLFNLQNDLNERVISEQFLC